MPADTETNIREEEVVDYTVRSKERRVGKKKKNTWNKVQRRSDLTRPAL